MPVLNGGRSGNIYVIAPCVSCMVGAQKGGMGTRIVTSPNRTERPTMTILTNQSTDVLFECKAVDVTDTTRKVEGVGQSRLLPRWSHAMSSSCIDPKQTPPMADVASSQTALRNAKW